VSVSIINEIWSKRSVALSVLFVGGTGQISLTSVCEAVAAGHKVTVFNRGKSSVAELPAGVTTIVGDIHDQETYAKLGASKFDVVCAFMVFKPEHIRQDIATFSGKVGQYVFISSASCYLKPVRHYIITEKTPLENPYWEYSRNKIACERLLQDQSKLCCLVSPVTTNRQLCSTAKPCNSSVWVAWSGLGFLIGTSGGGGRDSESFHTGRSSHVETTGGKTPVSASVNPSYWKDDSHLVSTPSGWVKPSPHRALDIAEIPGIIEDYGKAAERAKAAEFGDKPEGQPLTYDFSVITEKGVTTSSD
jgi:hypothetical protein